MLAPVTSGIVLLALVSVLPQASTTPRVSPTDAPAVALHPDAESLAADAGVSPAEASAMLDDQEAFGEALSVVRSKFPEKFADAWIEYEPSHSLSASFVGDVPPEATEIFEGEGVSVDVLPGAPMSELELMQLQDEVSDALVKDGFDVFTVTFDAQLGKVDVTLPEAVRGSPLPPETEDDSVVVAYSQAAAEPETVRGGARLTSSATGGGCTSGFSVENGGPGGNIEGIATAGHCESMDRYHHPGPGDAIAMDYRNQHTGLHGDVEWHTTNENEVAEFYDGSGTRVVEQVRQENAFARGQRICKYGRTSDYGCADVHRLSGDCNYPGYHRMNNMVIMDRIITEFGDSGGPWFIGNTAAGIHSGRCTGNDDRLGSAFSYAARLPEAMSVSVRRR